MNARSWTQRSGDASGASSKRAVTRRPSPVEFIQRKESCACGGSCPKCQAKSSVGDLPISRAGDAGEVEADRVADRVVRGDSVSGQIGSADAGIARAAEGGTTTGNAEPARVSSAIRAHRGSGQALDANTQATMSGRFGHDFSGVRVHADDAAARLSETINAKAFTIGNDVFFSRGRYAPSSSAGARLLAHELTHVVQQQGSSAIVQRDVEDETLDSGAETMEVAPESGGVEEIPGEESVPEEMRGGCNAQSNKRFLLANSVPFEFTVPPGCSATVTFTALWVPVGDYVDCCTGADTYQVTRNGGQPRNLPVGPNICNADEHPPGVGTMRTGSGRQRFNVQVNRSGCEGIKMQLHVNIRIH